MARVRPRAGPVGHPGRAYEDEGAAPCLPFPTGTRTPGLLEGIRPEPQAYVFPSVLRAAVLPGDATLNHFFKRLDWRSGLSPHGTRGNGSDLLREHGFSREVVELLLAHAERNKVTAAYHHHEMADERRRASVPADQIDRVACCPHGSTVAEARDSTCQRLVWVTASQLETDLWLCGRWSSTLRQGTGSVLTGTTSMRKTVFLALVLLGCGPVCWPP